MEYYELLGGGAGTMTTRLLSQLAVGSEECGAPCRGGRGWEGGVRGGRGGPCGAHYSPPAAGWSWRPKLPRWRRSSRRRPCPSGNIEPGSWSSWTDPGKSGTQRWAGVSKGMMWRHRHHRQQIRRVRLSSHTHTHALLVWRWKVNKVPQPDPLALSVCVCEEKCPEKVLSPVKGSRTAMFVCNWASVADGFPVLCNLAIRYVGVCVYVCQCVCVCVWECAWVLGASEGLWTRPETGVQA